MPLPNIIVGLYPDVPAFRGVPQLARSPTATQLRALAVATAAVKGRLWQSASTQPKWGIFPAGFKQDTTTLSLRDRIIGANPFRTQTTEQAGGRVIVPDSILAFDNRNEFRVADFPVQRGAFASYNKVATPFELSVRLSKSSDLAGRAQFLQSIDDALKSLALYDVRTPERTYYDVNIIRYEVTRRGPAGAYFLTEVNVFFREIRQVAAQYSSTTAATRNAQEPSAQPSQAQGVVQPAAVPPTVADGF